MIVDSYEQPIERPTDYKEQKKYYSGKQKKHTLRLIRWRIGAIVLCQEKSISTEKNSKNHVIKIGSYD